MFCVLVTFRFQLPSLASSHVKVSLCQYRDSPLTSPSASPRRYWKLGTLQPQAELQGLGGGLPPDMQYAGPPVRDICLVLMNTPPAMGQIVPLPCGHLVDMKG